MAAARRVPELPDAELAVVLSSTVWFHNRVPLEPRSMAKGM